MVKIIAVGAIGAFVVSGPLQHLGVLPETPLGDASKSVIKMVLNGTVHDAFGRCRGGISSRATTASAMVVWTRLQAGLQTTARPTPGRSAKIALADALLPGGA